jgi:ABC-type transporter Mla MlaB component
MLVSHAGPASPIVPPPLPLVVDLECHGEAATLYLSGVLDPREAMRAVRACERLPAHVRTLRADLRNVVVAVEGSLETFALLLGEWRAVRRVQARIDLPRVPAAA